MTATAETPAAPREYRITFHRLAGRHGDRVARRGDPIPALDLTVGPLTAAEIATAVRRYLTDPDPSPYVRRVAGVTVADDGRHGTVTRPGRGDGGPVPVVAFNVMWRPKRGPGRPPVGAPTNLRLTPDLRERLEASRRPGEGVAEAARRLLAVALAPELADALALAAAAYDRADDRKRAAACRALLAELDDPRGEGEQ